MLYFATLMNSFINSNSFLIVSLGFSTYTIMSSANFFLSNLGSFFLFLSLLTAVAKTFNIMLTKSGKSGHPCLVPDLEGNAFSFSLLSIILAVGLFCMAFTMLSYVLLIPTYLRFIFLIYFIFGYARSSWLPWAFL